MSRDIVKYNRCSSNFQVSARNAGPASGTSCCKVPPSHKVRVQESTRRKTVVTPRKYTTTEIVTRTVDIKPKRKAGLSNPPPPKKPRIKMATKAKSSSNRVSSSSQVTYSKDFTDESSSESYSESESSDSYTDED